MKSRIIVESSARPEDIRGIVALGRRNQRDEVAPERKDQGFVSIVYAEEQLLAAARTTPHAVARLDTRVVGYALAMSPREPIPEPLVPYRDDLDRSPWGETTLGRVHYLLMGQVCVDENVRGQGLFRRLYEELRRRHARAYRVVATVISEDNGHSRACHAALGFREFGRGGWPDGRRWVYVVWDWRENPDASQRGHPPRP